MTTDSPPDAFVDLWSTDRKTQDAAYAAMMAVTDPPIPWAYDVWDEVVQNLTHASNKNRAIAAQILANFAASDPDARIVDDIPALIEVTRDERFVTARHCMQSLWKVAVAGDAQRDAVVAGLGTRFAECGPERNATLIRFDVVVALRAIHDVAPSDDLAATAHALIATEADAKYRAKYAKVWRDVPDPSAD